MQKAVQKNCKALSDHLSMLGSTLDDPDNMLVVANDLANCYSKEFCPLYHQCAANQIDPNFTANLKDCLEKIADLLCHSFDKKIEKAPDANEVMSTNILDCQSLLINLSKNTGVLSHNSNALKIFLDGIKSSIQHLETSSSKSLNLFRSLCCFSQSSVRSVIKTIISV